MAFFNQKEDVIDLQLTQYGKYLVSQGEFKPVYYSFLDDDILYDQRYATGSGPEAQKEIEGRILNETPRNKTQYLFHSVEQLEELNDLRRTDIAEYKEKIQQSPERHYTSVAPLGNSHLLDEMAPAFDIKLHKGVISSSITTISGAGTTTTYSTQRIPQINLHDVVFYTSVKDTTSDDPDQRPVITELFQDGTYIDVELRDEITDFLINQNHSDRDIAYNGMLDKVKVLDFIQRRG